MKQVLKYLISLPFLRNLGIASAIAFFLLLFILLFLRIYTLHNRTIEVPDFTDMTLESSEELVALRKLESEIFDSIYLAGKPTGVVLEQHPKPGAKVKKGRRIFFTINSSGPEKVYMPSLVGETLPNAKAKLQTLGLLLGELRYRYDITKNVVLEQQYHYQKIEPGDTLFKGSKIDLVLGKGLGTELTPVPDLIGLTEEQARYRAGQAMLSVGATIPDHTITKDLPDSLTPFVFRQSPIHDNATRVKLGSPVDLWITLDSTKLPNYVKPDTNVYILDDIEGTDE